MATSTLIQYLETERYGSLPGSGAEATGTETLNRRQTETFIAASAVVAGDVVSLDASQAADGDKAIKVRKGDTGSTDAVCAVGVALASAGAGEKVEVCVRGVCEANTAAHAKGDVLTLTATAGRLGTIAAATAPQVAVSLDGAAGPGLSTVFVRGAF